ncbi:S9 family peptidase [Candidatus Sumerlaeota bacterium]|nr:S9 family peptidase [Candidatus Sumerlaeota bacterium]
MMNTRSLLPLVLAIALLAGCISKPPEPETPESIALRGDTRQVGEMHLQGIPEIPEAVAERTRLWTNARSAGFLDWDPDGEGMLIRTRFSDTEQLHLVTLPMGMRRQITFFEEPIWSAQFLRHSEGRALLFDMDEGGDEFSQIFRLDLETGDREMLTDGESRNSSPVAANHSALLAYASTRRNGRDNDIWVQRPGEEARLVYEADGSFWPLEWSPDDSRLLIVKYISINESIPYLLDPETGEVERLFPEADEPIAYMSAAFSPAEPGVLYFTSDEGMEFQVLRRRLPDGSQEMLTPDLPWDVESVEISEDGRWLAYASNESGASRLYLVDLTVDDFLPELIDLPLGVLLGMDFDDASTRLAFTLNSPRSPSDIFSLDLATREITRWTESEVGGLDTSQFVIPELIEYESLDGLTIPAWCAVPPEAERPVPVIVVIHGGPEGQAQPHFSSTVAQWNLDLGCAVIQPNVRGSSGYGKSYLLLDNGFQREDSVRDIGALLDWIEANPDLDASRVMVLGGSYGGYMVLATMAMFPDRIACGASSVGISNFVTFLESTQEYRRDLRRAEYGDERDPEMRTFLESISPTTNAHRIRSPLLVVQGFNDPRVPWTEAEQIVEAVRANGVPVWYMLAMDEGHGLAKKPNWDLFRQVVAMFIGDFLIGEER